MTGVKQIEATIGEHQRFPALRKRFRSWTSASSSKILAIASIEPCLMRSEQLFDAGVRQRADLFRFSCAFGLDPSFSFSQNIEASRKLWRSINWCDRF